MFNWDDETCEFGTSVFKNMYHVVVRVVVVVVVGGEEDGSYMKFVKLGGSSM